MSWKRWLRAARNGLLVLMLAAVCIGGSLLAACRIADRPLFDETTAPVRAAWQEVRAAAALLAGQASAGAAVAAEQVRAAAEDARAAFAQTVERLDAALHPPEPDDAQVAGAPAIVTRFEPAPPDVTTLMNLDGQETLLGGSYALPYFNQADPAWADCPFGIDPVGTHGCGPTALAMAVSALTGTLEDPAELAAWAAEAGYAAPHSGSYLTIVEGAAAHYGLNCASPAALTPEAITEALWDGGLLVALMGPGHFTRGGHFILLHGITLTGEILVADPYSRENSLMTWDADLLCSELSASHYAGGPLWILKKSATL